MSRIDSSSQVSKFPGGGNVFYYILSSVFYTFSLSTTGTRALGTSPARQFTAHA